DEDSNRRDLIAADVATLQQAITTLTRAACILRITFQEPIVRFRKRPAGRAVTSAANVAPTAPPLAGRISTSFALAEQAGVGTVGARKAFRKAESGPRRAGTATKR